MSRINDKRALEARITRAWYEGAWWLWPLWPLTLVTGWITRYRRRRFLAAPAITSGAPVIVVGGITVGGTGKTPVIIALCEQLMAHGLRVAVVSRGYGGDVADEPVVVNERSTAAAVGDEPLLIALRCDCPVIVGRQRSLAVQRAQDFGPSLILSDDGLQHYAMARQFEVAVLDSRRGLGNGRLLPMGPLREPATRLDSVDWILERNGQDAETRFHYVAEHLRHWRSRETLSIDQAVAKWQGRVALAAVTALGQPQQFFEGLEALGLSPQTYAFPDHYTLTKKDLDGIWADVIILTEKDAVKIESFDDDRVWVLSIRADIPQALVTTLIERFGKQAEVPCTTS